MRVGVFGAGGPAGINVMRSLVEARHEVVGIDANPMHLPWVAVYGEPVLLPEPTVDDVNYLELDAVHSQSEEQVLWIAQNKERLSAATLCPSPGVVLLTQDKWEACLQFRRAGLRQDRVELVQDPVGVMDVCAEFNFPFWMRARYGAGARGSALIEDRHQAIHWFSYWQARDPQIDFIAEAYLPGRDLAWTSLWYEGELIASFGRERLEYIYPRLAPSGRTGTPTIARTVHDDALNYAAMKTVESCDEKPHGFYSVDLREDVEGLPRPTEINAGRCFTTSYFSTAAGLNFMDLWCDLTRGRNQKVLVESLNSIPAGLTWMRHIDCPELLLDERGERVSYFGQPQPRRRRPNPRERMASQTRGPRARRDFT